MDKIKVFETVGGFIEAYGWSFLILVGMGLLIAILCEAIVKKSCDWLAEKWKDKPNLLAALNAARIIAIQIFCWGLSIWFGFILAKSMPLPGGMVLLPFWVALIYGIQYFFSMVGIKGLIEWKKNREAKKHEPKPEKEILTATEVKGVFRNKNGELCDKHGNLISF